MNRADFQQLADLRIDEAGVLLHHGKSDGTYYLAGYAVECALKACIARLTNQYDFPDKQFAQRCYTHSIKELVVLAQLQAQRDADAAANTALSANWTIVEDWTESSRYDRKSPDETQKLYDAITDMVNGVLPWIKWRW